MSMRNKMPIFVKQHVKKILLALVCMITGFVVAQNDTVNYEYGFSSVVSSGKYAPFLFHSSSFGSVSHLPVSGGLFASVYKPFQSDKKAFDYSFKVSSLLRSDNQNTEIYFHEIYADSRLWFLNLTIGIKEESFGNQDTELSGGGLLFSNNARPLPRITAGIREFTAIPFTFGLIQIKGGLSQGWFSDHVYIDNLLLHHKFAYVRVGGKLPVHVEYGLEHACQWGGTVQSTGQTLGGWKDYFRIFLGKSGTTDVPLSEQINALGNHIISQNAKVDFRIKDYQFAAYWQNISEDGPINFIWSTLNLPDGLWGFSVKNDKLPVFQSFLYEYLCTTDQTGPFHDEDGIIYGGADNYFENGLVLNSWNHWGKTIGTPYITSPVFNTSDLLYTENNRVSVHHFGLKGSYSDTNYKMLLSVSRNYGTYTTPYKPYKPQTSFLMEVNHRFKNFYNIECGLSLGIDVGTLYGNSTGCMFTLKKSGLLFSY